MNEGINLNGPIDTISSGFNTLLDSGADIYTKYLQLQNIKKAKKSSAQYADLLATTNTSRQATASSSYLKYGIYALIFTSVGLIAYKAMKKYK